MKIINFIRPVVNLVSIFILGFGCLISYSFFRPDFSEKQCETIRQNYRQIKIGMDKEEVLSILDARVRTKTYPYAGAISPEQKTQWEIWLLCADLDSCIITNSGKEKCSKSHMIAFDFQTGIVVKIFSDLPGDIGFF